MKKIYFLFVLLLLSACASKAPDIDGFERKNYHADYLTLTGQEKNIKPGEKVRVYIDGNASTRGLFNKETVLENPVAAQLAQKDKTKSILYLDRPCYFSNDNMCKPAIWKEGKYLPEVIDEVVAALYNFADKHKIPEYELVGYDGGAAVALLVATRLNSKKVKVSKVITIAGILDTEQYARSNDESLHEACLNPAREGYSLSKIPQLHIVGALDKKTPAFYVQQFKNIMRNPVSFKVESYASANHDNWAKIKMKY